MAVNNDQPLVDAMTSLTQQLASLQQFLARQSVGANRSSAPSSAGIQIPQTALSRATILGLEGYGGPSMPPPADAPQQFGANKAPSNPQVVDKITEENTGNIKDISNVLAAAQLVHGPQFFRNWTLGAYNLQKSVGIANTFGQYLNPGTDVYDPYTQQEILSNQGGMLRNTAGSFLQKFTDSNGNITTPLGNLSPNKQQFISTVAAMVGSINSGLGTEATIGQTFGYGPGALGNAFLGHRLPQVGGAQTIGMGADALRNWLQGHSVGDFGSGQNITGDQAQSMLDVIMNQGFAPVGAKTPWSTPGGSDAMTVAGSFMAPLMSKMPGLSADTLGEFTPALRNSATSATQLADALSNVDKQSQAAKESVNQFTAGLASSAQSFASMGANLPAAIGTASAFSEATGMDSQVAAQLGQNPLIQGMALSQGVLPSGIGNMGGAFTSLSESTVKMLGGALQSLDYNQYKTVNGQKFMTRNGQIMEDSQIASMLGIPETVVQRMLGGSNRIDHIASAKELLGSPTGNTGLYQQFEADRNSKGKVTNATDREALKAHWEAMIPSLERAGISQKHIRELTNDKNWRDRLKETDRLLGNNGGKSDYNKIVKTSVTVGLTPNAARILKIMEGPSDNQIVANAGGQSMRETMTQPQKDNSNKAQKYGVGPQYGTGLYGGSAGPRIEIGK